MPQTSDYLLSDAQANKTGYRLEKRNIPWYDVGHENLKVKLLFDKFDTPQAFAASTDPIYQRAANRFILHYFPEFYPAYRVDVRGKDDSVPPEVESIYHRLRTAINDPLNSQLSAVYYRPHSPALHPTKDIVLVTLNMFRFPLTRTEVEQAKEKSKSMMASYNDVQNLSLPAADEVTVYTTKSPRRLREVMEMLGMLPEMSVALEFFNRDENIVSTGDTTTLIMGSFMESQNLVNDGLSSFNRQMNGFEGSLPISLDFNSIQMSMMKMLNIVVTELMKDLTDNYNATKFTHGSSEIDFADADILVLGFGKRRSGTGDVTLAGISYVVNELSSRTQILKTGYMTNVLYNLELNDPLVMATLKNYEHLVQMMELAGGPGGNPPSFLDFLQQGSGDFGIAGNTVWNDLPTPIDTENMFVREAAKLGVIDLGDVKDLEKGFKLALSKSELREYRQKVRNNPELYKKVLNKNKTQALSAVVNVSRGIEGILNGNFPGLKKNSKLGQLLRKIGVDQLAKEALICATFGMAPAFARLVAAVRGAVQSVGRQIYEEPDEPKSGMSMREINLDMFKAFTLDGDLWKMILKMMLDTLMEGVLEVIKALAALLKELCKLNNPAADDYGANNLSDLVNNNLNDGAQNLPSINVQSDLNPTGRAATPRPPGWNGGLPGGVGGANPGQGPPWDRVFGDEGLSSEQLMKYLTDLSAILSSMDICFLFTNREEVPYETIEKIIDFNLEYSDLYIRTTLNTYSAVIGFFAKLSKYVDLTEFCNKVATDLFNANVENLCLLEDAAPDAIDEALQKILNNIGDDGVQLDNPGGPPFNGAARAPGTFGPDDRGRPEGTGINLECPNRPNFMENPLFSDTLPGILQALIEVVEIDFVSSVGAAQQALKEPSVCSNASTNLISQTMAASDAFANAEQMEEMSQVAKDILATMQEVFARMGDMMDHMQEHCDVGDILGLEAEVVEQVIDTIIDVLNELLNDPEFSNAIQNIGQTMANIAQGLGDPTTPAAPPAVTYEFPAEFRTKFEEYMKSVDLSFTPASSFTMGQVPYPSIVESGKFSSTTPGLASPTSYSSYKPAEIAFRFAKKARTEWQAVPGESYTRPDGSPATVTFPGTDTPVTIPKYRRVSVGGDATDSLKVKFPRKSTVEGDTDSKYIQVTLDSTILPDSTAGVTFGPAVPPAGSADRGRDTNPYAALFSNQFLDEVYGAGAPEEQVLRELDTVLFPSAYGGLVQSSFDYVRNNGIFDTEKLNSLNFFHDNSNCLPSDVSDLLDVSSILEELNDEMLDSLCYDASEPGPNPTGAKIREVIRYGIFLLLIQVHIAQFIIKNIFVFSAFEVNHILQDPLVKQFMAVTIREQVEAFLHSYPIVSAKMVPYFNKKIKRPFAVQEGGLANSSGEIVFPLGKEFEHVDFSSIIEYAVERRISNSRIPVSNAVKNSSSMVNPKPFNKAFLEDIVTFQPGWLGAWSWGDLDKNNADIYVRQNPAFAPGQEWGKYDSERKYIKTWNSNTQAETETAMLAKIRDIDEELGTLTYGKLVLERRLEWDNVEGVDGGVVPSILQKTTGEGYGLELDLFKKVLFNSRMRKATGGEAAGEKLRFTNLSLTYQVVYYLPESIDSGTDIEDNLSIQYYIANQRPRLSMNFGDGIQLYRVPLQKLTTSLPVANSITTTETRSKFVFNTAAGEYQQQDVPVLYSQLQLYGETATNSELLAIVIDPVFKDVFGKTFNKDLTTLVPVLHNFYLTTSFFPKFDTLLKAPKERCIQIFTDSVKNENRRGPDDPGPSPQALAAAGANGSGIPDILTQSALEFILKMLIETPINILKGVCEMMDPHVAISKLIRDITGGAFFMVSQVIDATPPITFLRDGPGPDAEGFDPGGLAPGISGEGVMKLLFCMLKIAMEASMQGFHLNLEPPNEPFPPPSSPDARAFLGETIFGRGAAVPLGNPPKAGPFDLSEGLTYVEGDPDPRDPRNNVPDEIKENFFPRITVEGVDFTGTFLGLLMLPPGPFGIIYLLVMLLKSLLEEELEGAMGDDRGEGVTNVSGEEPGTEC